MGLCRNPPQVRSGAAFGAGWFPPVRHPDRFESVPEDGRARRSPGSRALQRGSRCHGMAASVAATRWACRPGPLVALGAPCRAVLAQNSQPETLCSKQTQQHGRSVVQLGIASRRSPSEGSIGRSALLEASRQRDQGPEACKAAGPADRPAAEVPALCSPLLAAIAAG